MKKSDFKGGNSKEPCSQVISYKNKYAAINNYLKQNAIVVMENQVKMSIGEAISPIRAILLLPRDFSDLKTSNKKSYFQNVNLHMCCITRLNDELNVYSHFLNSKGIPVTDEIIDSNYLIIILLSTFLVLNSKVRKF